MHELTLAEAAYLAALPKGPNNYNPFRYPDRAIERRNWVIDRMVENGYATAGGGRGGQEGAARRQDRAAPLRASSRADYFAEEVRRQLIEMYGEKTLYEGGLSVRTSLDPGLQVMARQALMDGLINYDTGRGWRGPVAHLDDLGTGLGR